MTIEQMRSCVAGAYFGDQWKKKVAKMPDDQIVALYHSLVKQGKIK